MSMANILPRITIFVMVFLFSCALIISKESPCYAAPGDTVIVATNNNVVLNNTDVNYGVRTEVARFTNTSGVNIWNSMIQHYPDGWGYFRSSASGTRYDLNGTIRIEIRKNGVNGELIWNETRNIVNGHQSSGSFILGMNNLLLNTTLKYGESLHWVVTQCLTITGGTQLKLTAISDPNFRWVINYWQSDALVQQSVDNAYNAYLSANTAATNATNAMNAANAAKTSADNANSNAYIASTRAQTAIDQTWYSGKYGGSPESTADITGYIRNTQLPNLETKINNLQTSVTNIQNADNLPPSVEIDTVSGAKATSSSSIQLIVAASDNKSSTFTYSVNGGGYSSLPADGKITVSLPAVGPNTVTVRVKDDAGNVTTKTIKIWRLS
ncbi:MAG: hypothetical protein HPY89_05950 [Pelotomaculum sp.]|nr:hypothetical protein [Pelotomaculum sp.]